VKLASTPPPGAGTGVVEVYEAELAQRFGTGHAVAVASGTAAVHTALAVTGIGPGDEVLVPAVSVVMSIAPVLYVGARPVFVDSDPTGTDFDYDDLAAKTGPAARVVLPVYLWGRAGDPVRLSEFAAANQLIVIEDACQAHGTRIHDRQLGTHGAVGCFSTHASKILTSGEGGFLLTDDARIADLARAFPSHWQTPPPDQTPLSHLGHNYRLAAPLADLARTHLAGFDQKLDRRRAQSRLLSSLLATAPGLHPVRSRHGEDWNGCAAVLRVALLRPRAFLRHLATCGVPNSVGTFGLAAGDQQPIFAGDTPATCRIAATVLDSTLAVVLTEHDDDDRLHEYANTIAREAHQWGRT
jgi:perosamine synthetase